MYKVILETPLHKRITMRLKKCIAGFVSEVRSQQRSKILTQISHIFSCIILIRPQDSQDLNAIVVFFYILQNDICQFGERISFVILDKPKS